ncbi:MAG: trypsin-like peptidase domain-containing protein [Oscillospiraceae bacterium]|jgi:S1-C subfamily serine protease|nr:trypsin-like peptidase domain-containing protein [Oscillospiraceae bacterium]
MRKTAIILALVILASAAIAPLSSALGGMTRFYPVRSSDGGVFEDVDSGAWYAASVKSAYELGLIDGRGGGKFDPAGTLTIAEAVKLAVTVHRIYNAAPRPLAGGSPWYAPYMEYARANGIAGAELPNPGARASRSDFAVILASALPEEELTPINRIDDGAIPDVAAGYSYGPAVYALYRAGVLTGAAADGSFYPGRGVSRAEAAAVISRMALPDARASSPLLSALTAEALYELCAPAVFYVEVYDANGNRVKSGSGFFIDGDGTALTNYHVLSGGTTASVTLSSGEQYDILGIYDYDETRDIAVVKVDGGGFRALEAADSSKVSAGDTVYTIGSPLGLSGSISAGIVSSALRTVEDGEYIQIDAAISSGSSGGALLDAYGRVIGITSGTYSGGQNVNFAVPIDALSALSLDSLAELASLLPDTVYYPDHFPTPDFGAYADIPLHSRDSDDEGVYFRYDRGALPEELDPVLEGYGKLLEQNFFSHLGYVSTTGGVSQAYINGVYGLFVIYGPEIIDGKEYIVVTIISLM